jgi:putative transposase
MPKGYKSTSTSVHFLGYHFVWCPKYRRPVLLGKIRDRLEELINQKSEELGCRIISLSIQPDHIHLFIGSTPTLSPNRVIGEIKGFSSRILRKEFRELKSKLPTLWTRSYFISSHGHISDKMIEKYIEEQRGM